MVYISLGQNIKEFFDLKINNQKIPVEKGFFLYVFYTYKQDSNLNNELIKIFHESRIFYQFKSVCDKFNTQKR